MLPGSGSQPAVYVMHVVLQVDEDDAEPSSPRPASLAARELQAKLAAARAGAGGGGGHQRLKGLLKGGSFKSKGAAAAAVPHRRAPTQPAAARQQGLPAVQQPPAAHEAAQQAQPQHRSEHPAAQREQQSAAERQHAPSAGTAPTLQQHHDHHHHHHQQQQQQQRPAAPKTSPVKPRGQDARSGGRPAQRYAPGNSHAAEAAVQQRRPTAQRSIKRRDAGSTERCIPHPCHAQPPVLAGGSLHSRVPGMPAVHPVGHATI